MKTITSGDRIILQSGLMKAEILTPWSNDYTLTRFAHTGFVSGLWMGDVCFTQAERAQAHQISTGGVGLCSEYKCPAIEMDSAVGEEYLKVGVGVLRRTEKPWRIVDEQRVQGLPASLSACEDAAVFECLSPMVNGYAYREKRTLQLKEGVLRQEIEMENTGEKALDISEYCHNFVSLGGIPTDETHRLELFGAQLQPTAAGSVLQRAECGAVWTGPVSSSFSSECDVTGPAQPLAWRLTSSRTSASIAEALEFAPSSVYLWGTEYCVCAEVYKGLLIQPGQTARWSREWHVSI